MTPLRGSVDRRVRVLILRRRLEEHAADLVERATDTRPAQHSCVSRRLMLLTAGVSGTRWDAAYGLARRAGNVYGQTSAVLHSNRAFADVPEHLVREWEQVVADVAAAVGQPIPVAQGRGPGATWP